MPLGLNSLLSHIVFGENTMNGNNMLEGRTGPITQSVDAVKSLLTWRGRGCNPMPSTVEFVQEDEGSRLVLVRSNKKDSYYVVTPAKCSCPSATYHPGQPCKHQRKHFPQVAMPAAEEESIRPEGKWPGGMNGPVDSIPGEEKASSSLSIIDCHDTSDKDAAYWSIQEDKILWPLEA